MAKQHEIAYAERMNAAHAVHKPFSDGFCGFNLIRIGTIFTLLPPPPARILDLGCGTGWTSAFFARAGYEVVGVDIAPEMVRLANEQRDAAGLTGLSFVVSDYENLAFRDEFDCALFFDSLHHADDEGLAVRRAFAALRPGGVCIADEPGEGHAHAESSVTAVAEFGVTEKDMPPAHVVALGRAAGFTGFTVFPSPTTFNEKVFEKRGAPVADPFAGIAESAIDPRGGRVGRLRWRSGLAFGRAQAGWRSLLYSLQQLRKNGLVLMQKPAPLVP